jgi:transposase InsO family protein
MWWRMRCPAQWRRPPPGSSGSAQPSPTNHLWTSRTWLSARSSAHRYKLSAPARGCASSLRRSATLTSSATHPLGLSARWYPETFSDRYLNTSTGPPTPAGGQPAASSPPGMYVCLSTDVTAWAKACLGCQRAKVHPHVQVPPQHIPVPSSHFSHIHVDLVGPLPASKGFTYLFTIIDRTSCWPKAIPIAATTTVDCAKALFQGWVSRFGVPAVITSDRGAQFTSSLWAALCSLLNIQHNQTTAYHPQSNGMVERFPPPSEGRPPRPLCRGELGRPPSVGPPRPPRSSQGRWLHPRSGSVRLTTHFIGQFLDSPEIPPKIFLEQFSKTAPPALPKVRGRPPAAVCFRDFPPPGAAVAHRVHFAPQQPAEPRREPFSPGTPPGVFARPAAVLYHTAAQPARNRRAPSRLDL